MKKSKMRTWSDKLDKVKCPECKGTRFYRTVLHEQGVFEIVRDKAGLRDEALTMFDTEYEYRCQNVKCEEVLNLNEVC